VVLLVALSTLLVGLGLVIFSSVQAPFDRLFAQLNGAHLWIYSDRGVPLTAAQVDAVTHAPGVTSSTGLEELAQGFVLQGSQEIRANLRSFPAQQLPINQLLITQGSKLSENDPSGVIIDQAFAGVHHLHVGDMITLVTTGGEQQMRVRGVALDVDHDSQSDGTVGQVHLLKSTLNELYAPSQLLDVIGLRLVNPSATYAAFGAIVDRLQAQGYPDPNRNLGWEDWLSFRAGFGAASRLSAALLLGFGVVSLLAAGVIVVNLVIGQVLAQQRDLGILKAVGFTPRQVTRTLVLEYLLVGAVGTALGLGLVVLLAPRLLERLVGTVGVIVPPQYSLPLVVLVILAILLVIGVSAGLPAWKAGRMRTADVIRPGGAAPGRGLTRLAGLLLSGGMPAISALGLRGVMGRPLRALLVWLTLLVGIMTAIFALGMTATIDRYSHDTALTGVFADMYIQPGLYDGQATQQLVASQPQIAYYYSSDQRAGQVAGGVGRMSVIFSTGDTRRVAATLSSGRWHSPTADELVLGDQAMQHFHLRLGDQIPLTFDLGTGQPVTITYTVVGSLFATQTADEAYAALNSLSAHAALPADELTRTGYEVTLRPGVSANGFAQILQQLSEGRVGVKVYDLSPPLAVTQAVGIMVLVSALLMVVAAVGILNAMLLSTRERARELGTLKAIGLTPGQVVRSVVEGALALGALALLVGIPLGLVLTAHGLQALVDGEGGLPHFQMGVNWPAIALLVPATLVVAALGAYLPARWAARVPVSTTLRYE
jgi:putative ABC transport system permease protein